MNEPLTRRDAYDVVIVGGGHNGLTAAAYLAGAGLSVAVLERLDHTGGAAVSAQAFPGFPTRLSRYSYLVSLLPESIISDLDLDLRLESRSTASYTPVLRGGVAGGLLVERPEGAATRDSFHDADRLRCRVRGLARLLPAGRRRRRRRCPHAHPAAAAGVAGAGAGRSGPLAGPGRAAAWRGGRAPLPGRDGTRRGRDRRADRHLRADAGAVAHPEPLLPLSPDRQRHRRVAGARRRDGRGHRRARRLGPQGGGGAGRERRGDRDPQRAGRRRGRCRRRRGDADPARPVRAGERRPVGPGGPARRGTGPGREAGRRPAEGQLPAHPAAPAGVGGGPADRVRRDPPPGRGLPRARAGLRGGGRRADSARGCRARSTAIR